MRGLPHPGVRVVCGRRLESGERCGGVHSEKVQGLHGRNADLGAGVARERLYGGLDGGFRGEGLRPQRAFRSRPTAVFASLVSTPISARVAESESRSSTAMSRAALTLSVVLRDASVRMPIVLCTAAAD